MTGRRGARPVVAALLVLSAATPSVVAEPADMAAGERLFRSQCMGCHSLDPGENRAGPTLHGLFGRPAGTLEGFDFSEAMAAAEIEWSAESLDAFLAAPSEVVPGTKMVFWGLEPEHRRQLIAYLRAAAQ